MIFTDKNYKKQEKEAVTNFVLLPRSRNMIELLRKTYLHKPPSNWVAHITRDFLTCYSCSYYSSMLKCLIYFINPFHATECHFFQYPFWFCDVFREYCKKPVAWSGLKFKIFRFLKFLQDFQTVFQRRLSMCCGMYIKVVSYDVKLLLFTLEIWWKLTNHYNIQY